MSVYPDILSVIPSLTPLSWSSSNVVLRTTFANGNEQRRLVWQYPRRGLVLQYNYITPYQFNILRTFYRNMEGPEQQFVFFFPHPGTYAGELCGGGDGTEEILNLPSKNLDSGVLVELRRGGTVLKLNKDFTLLRSTGPNGEDQALFNRLPDKPGYKYFLSFTGRLKIQVRFQSEPIMFNDIKAFATESTIKLIGLQPSII